MTDLRSRCPEKCPRRALEIYHPRMGGTGALDAKIMLVGEAPGQHEDQEGTPFIGASGRVLTELLLELGLDRTKVYITNAVKCATPEENEKPVKREITSCRYLLEREIKKISPNVLVAVGNVALESILKRTGITKLQNNILYSDEFKIKVIPVVHPAYVLRNPMALGDLRKGLELAITEATSAKIVTQATTRIIHWDARSRRQIDKLFTKLEKSRSFCIDLETTSKIPQEAKIINLAFSWAIGVGVTVRMDVLEDADIARLRNLLLSDREKIGHNIKYDIQVLMSNGFKVKPPIFDCLPAVALVDENIKDKGLDTLVLKYLDVGEYWTDLDAFKKKDMKEHKIDKDAYTYDRIPYKKILAPYAQYDADSTFRIAPILKSEMIKHHLMSFYNKYTLPTLWTILRMEYRGIQVNREKLKELGEECAVKIDSAASEIVSNPDVIKYQKIRGYQAVEKFKQKWEGSTALHSRYSTAPLYVKARLKSKDWKFNPGSTKQLREIFYDMMGLSAPKFTKKKQKSTDEESLRILVKEAEILLANQIITHRQLTKYKSTYIDSIYAKSARSGRIHPSYLQHRAVTGRLSSVSPNFQNIKRDAYDLKSCFLADPGMTILKADLAQAEFRCWAHYADDRRMIDEIESGMDIHKKTASEVFGIPESEVTKDQRTAAKSCVTGETWVPTNRGFKHISEIKIGDTVLDHANKPQEVLETIRKRAVVYHVETECGSLNCTADQPYYVINKSGMLTTKLLSEIKQRDYVLSCTPQNKRRGYVTWSFSGARRTSFKPVFKKWVLDERLAYLVGFILAEGSITQCGAKHATRWSQKGALVKTIDKLGKRIFGERLSRRVDSRTGVVDWYVSSIEFVEFLKYLGMSINNKKGFKHFPGKIIESSASVQHSFIQGYFAGDGTFKRDRACVGSVSSELIDHVCLLLRSFGIFPKIAIENPKGGHRFYNIQITNTEELKRLIQVVGVKPPKAWRYPRQTRGRKFIDNVRRWYLDHHPSADVRYAVKLRKTLTHAFLKKQCAGINEEVDKLVNHGIYSVRVKSITRLGKREVYDFVTTGDKTLVANGFYTLDCVFGLMYGRGTKAISEQYGISEEDAQSVRKLFFKKYPDAASWLDMQVAAAREYGCVKTWMGRIRRLPEINSGDKKAKAEAERQAKNAPIQGLASDMNNHFMVTTVKRARKAKIKCYPMTTIHDANVLQVKTAQVKQLAKLMQHVVDTAFPEFRCKMKLDFEAGDTLGTLKGVEL